MTQFTPEQERLLNWLKSGAGSRAKLSVHGFFSEATIKSLLDKGLIRDDWAKGYYTATEILKREG